MKKVLSAMLAVLFILLSLVFPSYAAEAENPSSPWTMVFHDEFEGTTLNTQYWNNYDPNITSADYFFYANSPETIVCPENVSVADGCLKLTAEYAPFEYGGASHSYKTGTIQSRDKVELTYGRYEARIKMPDLPGSNPAF